MADAIIFPGQGAQCVGMGKAWADHSPAAKAVFERADEALGFDLTGACWDGEVDVNRTDIAQPGIFTASAACIAGMTQVGSMPQGLQAAAGLSLGEYTALWWAGVLSFEDGVKLVRLRGEAMQAASEACSSGMVSLVGAELAQAEELAALGAKEGICAVANRNAPGQIVLSGELAALDAVEANAGEHGVRRAIRLSVAGGFHSECMRPAADRLAAALSEVSMASPKVPVISNVTARPVSGPDEVKSLLAQQVCSPVLWEDSVRWMISEGLTSFLEPSPGRVLSGILRKIDRDVECVSADEPAVDEEAQRS
jgi:[acyl-carrier-protein] S-malonyltransferase